MAKSQQTFNKSEKEKKRLKKRADKKKKMEARKAEAKESGKKGIEFAYVDHNGHLTDTPPDPSMKIKVDAKSIEISIPKSVEKVPCHFLIPRKDSVLSLILRTMKNIFVM
jgi:hypothetical protein